MSDDFSFKEKNFFKAVKYWKSRGYKSDYIRITREIMNYYFDYITTGKDSLVLDSSKYSRNDISFVLRELCLNSYRIIDSHPFRGFNTLIINFPHVSYY